MFTLSTDILTDTEERAEHLGIFVNDQTLTQPPSVVNILDRLKEDILSDNTDLNPQSGNKHKRSRYVNILVPISHRSSDTTGPQNQKSVTSSNSSSSCAPIINVGFLKVHKAGSTTIQNILQRFALSHNLNVALPKKNKTTDSHYHYLVFKNGLTLNNIIPIPKGQSYNMILNHAVYDKNTWHTILPEDTFYLAIARETESRFLSAAFYYGLVKRLQKETSSLFIFSELLKHPENFTKSHYYYNGMSYDFGIPEAHYNLHDRIYHHAKTFVDDFDLIMLVEYFDHSLVLLKRRLCWQLKDILYFQNNKGAKSSSREVLFSEDDKVNLQNWQTADAILYKVFSSVFWTRMKLEGEEFLLEVEHFKDVRSYVIAYCANKSRKDDLVVKASRWNDIFSVTREDCKQMVAKEFDLHDTLVQKAWNKMK